MSNTYKKQSDILISFCIPTYNRAEYIGNGVLSIINQETFDSDIEIIVSNDASQDSTDKVMRGLITEYKNSVLYTSQECNLGGDKNERFTLMKASGKYVFVLTDDDSLLPGALKNLRKSILNHPECTIFFSGYELLMEKSQKRKIVQTFTNEMIFDSKHNMDKVIKAFGSTHVLSRLCIRKDCLDLDGFSRHMSLNCSYPHMYLTGRAALIGPSFYINTPLILHVQENKKFWDYQNDYMICGKLSIINDLSKIKKDFYNIAIDKYIYPEIKSASAHSLSVNIKKFLLFTLTITTIKELRTKIKTWVYVFSGIFSFVRMKLKKNRGIYKDIDKDTSRDNNGMI